MLTRLPGTLTPETADEATTLIPSLNDKLHTDELQPILDELNKMRELEKALVVGNMKLTSRTEDRLR
jgi:hypothetical protein